MDAPRFGTAGGGWIVDARPGVVTFFQYGNVTGVGESNPVYVSFYRYVGATGISGGGGSGASESSVNNFSARQIFTGGVDGSVADQLAAIQIDSRNVGTLADAFLFLTTVFFNASSWPSRKFWSSIFSTCGGSLAQHCVSMVK